MKKSWIAVVVGLSLGAIAGAASATLGKQEAVAMPCCSSCDDTYLACYDSCNGDPSCQYNCELKWDRCESYCSMGC